MTRIEFVWPDETTERVRAARGRLESAGETLRAMSFDERLAALGRVLERWTGDDAHWRDELVAALSAESALHEATIREGLEAALRAWSPERFVACVRDETARGVASAGAVLSPFAWTAVLAGGGVPMPTMLNVLLPLALGSPVLMREASNDHATARVLRRSLEVADERLARAFESEAFPATDEAFEVLLEAPCIVATGSDETIRSIAGRVRAGARLVAFGHRFSIGVLGPGAADDASRLAALAEGFARDVARWDQMGCLSPVVVHLVDLEPAAAVRIASAIAEALARIEAEMPRGPLSTAVAASHHRERSEARMRATAGATRLFEGDAFTLVLEADARARPAPLHRFLRLLPVDSLAALERAVRPFGPHLSNVAVEGFTEAEERALHERIGGLGISRWTRPGRLQTPPIDWPHDGMPLSTPFARFSSSD